MCSSDAPAAPEALIAGEFAHLGRGFRARDARAGDLFTGYDGYVPEAGVERRAGEGGALAVSPHRLETLGNCPMEYFFRFVLGVELAEEYEADPTVWLGPQKMGTLLHEVFRRFMEALIGAGRTPVFERDRGLLSSILAGQIEAWKAEVPPLNPEVFERECRDLEAAARIFLREEESLCRTSLPLYCEVSIGISREGEHTALCTRDPVRLALPGGREMLAGGRIDRVDEVPDAGPGCFCVWDYKTGSTYGFDSEDPFRGGRKVQSTVYLRIVESRLRDLYPGARVVAFGYFFPGRRAYGERITWSAALLAPGAHVLALLLQMLESGCFPFTDKGSDVKYSDCLPAFGDTGEAEEAIKRKALNPVNTALGSFKELRGL